MDLSGIPPQDDTVIGSIRFDYSNVEKINKKFKKKFSKILRKKGKELRRKELRKILEFLNGENISMGAVKCTKYNWDKRLSNIPKQISYKKEKLYGILYFLALKMQSERGKHYSVVVCKESFMDINRVLSTCKELAEYYSLSYDFSISSGNLNFMIKIADYVASAGRKFKHIDLDEFDNFTFLSTDIPYYYVRYSFKLFDKRK